MSKRRIHIIGTGGTIAGVSKPGINNINTQGLSAYNAAVLSVDALLQGLQLADLRERFDITCEQLVNIDSKDMNPEVWWQLAQRLHALAQDAAVQGVVITHGTDTLEETSYFIELLRQSGAFTREAANKTQLGIVFTAAMRPADAPDADGPQNLCDALHVAAHAEAAEHGVLCVLQGRIHSALHVNKAHSTAIDAFNSQPHSPMGVVQGTTQRVHVSFSQALPSNNDSAFTALVQALKQGDAIQWPWVALITSHAGIDGRMVSLLLDAGVHGIVVACTGNGTLSKTLIEPLRDAIRKGVKVQRASRVWQGGVVAMPGDEFESAGEVSAVKARVKVMLQLAAMSHDNH